MKRITILLAVLTALYDANPLIAQSCMLESMEIVNVYNCTYTTYRADVTFQHNRPADSTYTVWRNALPDGLTQRIGTFPYSQDTVSLGALFKNADYAVYIIDDTESQCDVRDTIVPQFCPPPCMADMLMLSDQVRCLPSIQHVELRFDFPEPNFDGGFLFDVFVDSMFINNLFMWPWGEIVLPDYVLGDTILICQTDMPDCCQTFVLPEECNDYVCQSFAVGDAEPISCAGNLAHYVFNVQHNPPGQWTTELLIYNEHGQLVDVAILSEGDTLVDLHIPTSTVNRSYAVCDVFAPFPLCCFELVVPAISCDSLPVQVKTLDEQGIRVFPNPVSDHLVIDSGGRDEALSGMAYTLHHATGRTVAAGIIDRPQFTLQMTDEPAGIYLLRITHGDRLIGYHRFVKLPD